MQPILDLDSGRQQSCSGVITLLGGHGRQAPLRVSNFGFFMVSEDSQMSGHLDALGLFSF